MGYRFPPYSMISSSKINSSVRSSVPATGMTEVQFFFIEIYDIILKILSLTVDRWFESLSFNLGKY